MCGDSSIAAHRVVLSSASAYFKNFFKYASTESKTCEIDKGIVTQDGVLQTIIEYAYTGNVTIDAENVQELLVAASFLQIDFIVKESEKFMADNIEVDIVVELVRFGNQYNLCHLIDSVCKFISNHFEELNKNGAFWELSQTDMCSLIKNKWMSVLKGGIPILNPEAEILKFVGKYMSIASMSHEEFDNNTISNLLKNIHFEDIGKDEIKGIVDVYPIIDCDIVRSALNHPGKLTQREEVIDVKEMAATRVHANCNKHLLSSIAYARGGQVNDITETFDEKWQGEKDLNLRPKRFHIIIRRWDGRPVVGAMSVQYNNGMSIEYGGRPTDENKFVSEHEVKLDDDEVVVKMILRSGWMIDSLTFITNLGRTFGPYGGTGGTERISTPIHNPAYLHSFNGKEVITQGEYGITFLSFQWVVYHSGPRDILEIEASGNDDDDDWPFLYNSGSDVDSESNVSDFSY